MAVCEICGNDIEIVDALCPYCGNRNEGGDGTRKVPFSRKVVNLEAGRPVVEVALSRMSEFINDGKRNQITVLIFIHGYGSTGKGGAIRDECRKMLDFMKSNGTIADYIPGEEFDRRSGRIKSLVQRFPQLANDRNMNRGNRGITLVVLR